MQRNTIVKISQSDIHKTRKPLLKNIISENVFLWKRVSQRRRSIKLAKRFFKPEAIMEAKGVVLSVLKALTLRHS